MTSDHEQQQQNTTTGKETPMSDPFKIGESLRLPASVAARLERGELRPVPPAPSHDESTEDRAARAATREAYRRAKWERRLPSIYRTASLTDLAPDQNTRGMVAGWWASGHRTLLLFSSTPGTGKTHALYAVGNEAVDRGSWVEAWTSIELLSAMRPEGDPDAMNNAIECDLLCLDDLGQEVGTAWATQQMQHILSSRIAAGRRQVITTNLDDQAMCAAYTAPLIDRLVDDAVIVEFTGPSRRRPARWGGAQ